MVIMALSVRVGSSLAMDNAAKALQFQSVAASLNGREHQPSKLRGAGSSPAAVATSLKLHHSTPNRRAKFDAPSGAAGFRSS
jgi:hypothetical protein